MSPVSDKTCNAGNTLNVKRTPTSLRIKTKSMTTQIPSMTAKTTIDPPSTHGTPTALVQVEKKKKKSIIMSAPSTTPSQQANIGTNVRKIMSPALALKHDNPTAFIRTKKKETKSPTPPPLQRAKIDVNPPLTQDLEALVAEGLFPFVIVQCFPDS